MRAVSFAKFSERRSREPSMRGRISARASAVAMYSVGMTKRLPAIHSRTRNRVRQLAERSLADS